MVDYKIISIQLTMHYILRLITLRAVDVLGLNIPWKPISQCPLKRLLKKFRYQVSFVAIGYYQYWYFIVRYEYIVDTVLILPHLYTSLSEMSPKWTKSILVIFLIIDLIEEFTLFWTRNLLTISPSKQNTKSHRTSGYEIYLYIYCFS